MSASAHVANAELADRPVTVMGLGSFGGGAAVARFLAKRGARVTVTDLRSEAELAPALSELAGCDVRLVLGGHRVEDFTRTSLVVANPAVAPSSPFLRAAREAGVLVTSEIALFLEHCPARIAAVTGTQGKSSTCNMLAQLLNASGIAAHLGGNIGRSLLESTAEMDARDMVVLELSSYQLETLPSTLRGHHGPPRVEVACVTNVLADHLERHGSLAAYAAAKRRILELPAQVGGRALLSGEDPRCASWSLPGVRRVDFFFGPSARGLHIRAGNFRLDGELLGRVEDLRLPGLFQRENALLALGLARLLGADAQRLSAALGTLRGLPHRLEDLGLFRGHRVFDNGVSTTPDSTLGVLPSLAPGFALMVGGKAKDLPLEPLVDAARGCVRRVVAFGAAAERLAAAFRAADFEVWTAPDVPTAVGVAFERMEPGEELLFSPACASFDQFLNFKERASAFRAAIRGDSAHPSGCADEEKSTFPSRRYDKPKL